MNWGNKRLEVYENNFDISLVNKKILFVIGSTRISGGTNIIFQYASKLSEIGATVDVVSILDKENQGKEWNEKYQKFNFITMDSAVNDFYDLVIATWWPTLATLKNLNFATSLYFVQSIESRFIKSQNDQMLEKKIFSLYYSGIPMVTVANWMQRFLYESTGNLPWVVKNGIDKSIFYTKPEAENDGKSKLRVLLEGDMDSEFKAINETFDCLMELDDIEIAYVSPNDRRLIGNVRNINKIDFSRMADVYRDADVLVKMSRVEGMFGPPLEMFHCGGTAVVSKVSGHSEYVVNGKNALVVEVEDFDSLRNSVVTLSRDQNLIQTLKKGARQTAQSWPDISQTAKEFAHVCNVLIRSRFKHTPQWKALGEIESLIEKGNNSKFPDYRILPETP